VPSQEACAARFLSGISAALIHSSFDAQWRFFAKARLITAHALWHQLENVMCLAGLRLFVVGISLTDGWFRRG
jgi:hypothetical protein